jgi:peroxiredoxin
MSSPFYGKLMRPELAPGDPALPFDLPLLDGDGRVRLADFTGERPVALIFGSYT